MGTVFYTHWRYNFTMFGPLELVFCMLVVTENLGADEAGAATQTSLLP